MNTVQQKIRDELIIKLWFLKFNIQSVYHYMGTERSNDQLTGPERKNMTSESDASPAPVHGMVIVPLEWVYDHLICEFSHWDICLKGLVLRNGERWFCWLGDQYCDDVQYTIRKVNWTPECDEYLDDYRAAYVHWFHEGKPRCNYDGRPLDWFAEKWKHRNPIEDQAR